MTQHPCTTCPGLRAEVARLEAENTRLRIKVKKLETEIDRLLRIIYSVAQYCYSVAQSAARILKDHQARGTWSLAKGQYQVASVVYEALRGE